MRYYTPEEREIVFRDYPRIGPKVLAKRLKRSKDSLVSFAQRNGLRFTDGFDDERYVLVAEVIAATGIHHSMIYKAAHSAGVLRYRPYARGRYTRVVPVKWADDFIEQHERRAEVQEALAEQWYTTQKVAEIFGTSPGYVRLIIRGRRPNSKYTPLLMGIERRVSTCNHFLWNPYQVEEAWRKYREISN